MTSFQGAWLEALPEGSPRFEPVSGATFAEEQLSLERIEKLFPPKLSPP